ncbi:o-succinylbenzoate--CoA ligase [Saccharopolyspora hordei]|uniref:o-succinylbenzoate--CoA ligase n=1 Tax=Saccharopolyspora hordei TaxID=1838 RepID=UPI0035ED9819
MAAAPAGPLTPEEDAAEDPTALVIATSGSTGTPKGVVVSASALRASAGATHRRLGGPGHWLLAMPAHHIAGIQVLVRALLAGTRPDAVDTTEGFRPDRFATAARRVLAADGPHYTALVPTQLSRLVSAGGDGLAALREFDAVLLGGAATPPALLDRARAEGVRVTTTYGMSETSGGCVYDGVPLDTAEVRVEGETGPVLLSGPMLARGYRHQPEAAAFTGGWFRTGDLGRWRDGRLEVLGRADDMIITGGVNVAPLAVERVLTAQPGVREACVLGVPDPEWGQAVVAAVVPDDTAAPPAEPDLRAAVRAELNPAAAPKRVTFLPELPLRGPGKPDRRALAALFQG